MLRTSAAATSRKATVVTTNRAFADWRDLPNADFVVSMVDRPAQPRGGLYEGNANGF